VWGYREEKIKKGELLEREWNTLFERYRESHPELARLLEKSLNKDWEEDCRKLLPVWGGSDTLRSQNLRA
jgi:transketolase